MAAIGILTEEKEENADHGHFLLFISYEETRVKVKLLYVAALNIGLVLSKSTCSRIILLLFWQGENYHLQNKAVKLEALIV